MNITNGHPSENILYLFFPTTVDAPSIGTKSATAFKVASTNESFVSFIPTNN